jgi:hypothetical protein
LPKRGFSVVTLTKAVNAFVAERPGAGRARASLVFLLALVSGGCATNLSGTWKTVNVDPPGAPFPLHQVTFDEEGRYTASAMQDGEKHTSVGTYRQGLTFLEVRQDGRLPRNYRCKRLSDGSILLMFEEGEAKSTATLQREKAPE